MIWGNYNTVLFLGKLLWCPVMGKPLQYGQNCRWCQTKPKLNWTELLRMMFASTLDHYSARCALVSLRADHMSLPSLRVVVMSTTSVLTMWRKVFDEWNMDATPKYTKLHQFLLLCCVQCWSSMHHDCDVTPFTSCPFSLLLCAAVPRKDNIVGKGIQTPSLFWRIHILYQVWRETSICGATRSQQQLQHTER